MDKAPAVHEAALSEADVTQWLQQLQPHAAPGADAGADAGAGAGGNGPVNQLFAALYSDLKRQAAQQMRKESAGHTLSATALTHEAWFRLTEQTRTQWQSRSHFLGMASIMMRRILVNHAVARQAAKRDAVLVPLTLSEAAEVVGHGPGSCGNSGAEVVKVHDALLALEAVDARAAKVVELKFFGGLEIEEIAQVLGVGSATVKRDWALARAWLHREMQN